MRFSVVGLVVGALLALLVYIVGTAISHFRDEDLVWLIIAVLVWVACAFNWPHRGIDVR